MMRRNYVSKQNSFTQAIAFLVALHLFLPGPALALRAREAGELPETRSGLEEALQKSAGPDAALNAIGRIVESFLAKPSTPVVSTAGLEEVTPKQVSDRLDALFLLSRKAAGDWRVLSWMKAERPTFPYVLRGTFSHDTEVQGAFARTPMTFNEVQYLYWGNTASPHLLSRPQEFLFISLMPVVLMTLKQFYAQRGSEFIDGRSSCAYSDQRLMRWHMKSLESNLLRYCWMSRNFLS